jgi:hypothetical protein
MGLRAESYRVDIRPEGMQKPGGHKKSRIGPIRLLDQRELLFESVKGLHFAEISDLAYLPGRHWLFMVSDEGKLFRFRARFGEKIRELEPLAAEKIRKKNGKKLKKRRRDSEGLTLDGRGRLFVSFEGKPRIARLSYDGRIFAYLPLPRALASAKNFRGRNKELEALTWHPRYGLVTAAEYPLATGSDTIQTLYALSGKRWRYRRGREPHSAVTALEVLENGDFLILERAYSDPLSPMVVSLKALDPRHCGGAKLCPTRTLLRMDSSQGWQVENFEGLARVGKNRFVMISDDNDNFFQKTIMIYFEVVSR